MTRLLAALSLMLAWPVAAETHRFYGYAYDLESDRYLYTEVHEQNIVDGRWLGGSITYYLPDGRQLGYKTMDFGADPYVPVYRLDLPLEGYTEAITDNGDPLVLERREGESAKLETKTLKRDGLTCADSGFHAALVDNFDKLMQRETVNLRLVAAGSLDQFRFRARRIDDGSFEGRPAARFLVEPDSLLRFLVDPLELTYDPDTRQLLEYRGLSNIRDPQNGKPYVARIAYYSKPPPEAGTLPPLQTAPAAEAQAGSPPASPSDVPETPAEPADAATPES